MNKFTIQSRLYTYQTLLGKYDIIDKYKFSSRKFIKLNSIKFFYNTYKLLNNHLNLLTFQEFSMSQRFSIKNVDKVKLKTFQITLRNSLLFSYIENLLNSFFLKNKVNIIGNPSNKYLTLILQSSLNSEFFQDKISSFNTKFNLIINFKEKNPKLESFLSYYFIPITKF